MDSEAETRANTHISNTSAKTMPDRPKPEDMTKEDRQRVVLRFLADHNLALPPAVIFRNLRLHQRITFQDTTLENYLESFHRQGYVRRIDPEAMEKYRTEDLGDDSDKRAYYVITDEGRAWLDDF
jgi:hypothetical protein